MTIRTSPCTWPVVYDPGLTCDALTSSAASGTYEQMATDYLWVWTGRRFGTCQVTVRPCKADCWGYQSTYLGSEPMYGFQSQRVGSFLPALIAGEWRNLTCGSCGDNCSCSVIAQIGLPGPVVSVEDVTISGVTLSPANYRVDDHRWLVRTDGSLWPTCQDMGAASGTDGTWSVTYTWGVAVPAGGQVAAGVLACELAKAAAGQPCGLPQRVQTLTRQDVTIAMVDAFAGLEDGHTGIFLIDSWLDSMNKSPRRMRVYSPDVPNNSGVRRTTWPGSTPTSPYYGGGGY